jgi:hypothetical protein
MTQWKSSRLRNARFIRSVHDSHISSIHGPDDTWIASFIEIPDRADWVRVQRLWIRSKCTVRVSDIIEWTSRTFALLPDDNTLLLTATVQRSHALDMWIDGGDYGPIVVLFTDDGVHRYPSYVETLAWAYHVDSQTVHWYDHMNDASVNDVLCIALQHVCCLASSRSTRTKHRIQVIHDACLV